MLGPCTAAPGVLGPMSDVGGVGTVKYHIADHEYSRERFYNGLKAPDEVRNGLPGACQRLWCASL